jgi:tRNA (guanine-N7-)-methyltransferase
VGKHKLQRFYEINQFPNVIQPDYRESLQNDHVLKGNWKVDYFRNDNPIVLELGCGKGEYSVGLARKFPEKNYIGVDIKGARIWRGARTAIEEKIFNIGFLRTHIELINRFFAQNEVYEIWITFPDPQEKTRRKRKRLTSSRFLELYRKFLNKDGSINLKTDNVILFNYTKALVLENNFPVYACTEDLYKSSIEGLAYDIRTHYEQIFLSEGKRICYLKFAISSDEEIREPKE